MKLRIPQGCGAASHEGRLLAIAADGSVEVADDVARALAGHGFVVWQDEPDPQNIAGMTRDQLIMRVMDMTLQMLRATDTEAIRARLAVAESGPGSLPDEREGAGVTAFADADEDIAQMNRPALFAYLRAKGVAVSLPVTNEELRAAARRAGAA